MTDLQVGDTREQTSNVAPNFSSKMLFLLAGSGLIAAKVIYILVELYYNNTLQLFGSTPGIDTDDIDRFHVFGQQVAAIGATLLIGGFVLRRMAKRVHEGRSRPQWRLLGTVIVGVYISALVLQTLAINLMIEHSSDQTAYRAFAGTIAQALILSGVGNSFDLDSSINRYDMLVDDSETMLSLLPLASTRTDSFAERLMGNREAIAAALRAQIFHSRFRDDMGRFVSARQQLLESWRPINEAKNAINEKVREARVAILEPRIDGFLALLDRYQAYRTAQHRYKRYLSRMSTSQRRHAYNTFVERAGMPPTLSAAGFFENPKVRRKSGLYSDGRASAPMNIVADGKRVAAERDRMIERIKAKLADNLPADLVPYIDLDMDFDDFLELPPIRDRIEAKFGADNNIDLSVSAYLFFRDQWAPRVTDEVDDIVDGYVLDGPAAIVAPEMHEIRTKALKAAYVMPLALCLSTVFLLFNALTLVRWRKMNRCGRVVTGSIIGLLLLVSALNPLDGNGKMDSAYGLPDGVEQIARTTRLINIVGSMLTQIVPPTWLDLVPESVCDERRSMYQSSDGTFFRCFTY